MTLTETRGHSLKILGLPLPGSTLLPRRRDHGGGAIEVGYLRGRRSVGYGGRGGLQRHRADVTVRVLGVHRVMRVRWRVMMMMMVMEELGRGEGLAGIVRPGWVDRDRWALGRMQLGAHLVVQPTEHGAVPHAEVVALRQEYRARRAREAAHVEDELARTHHQLGRQDRRLAARAPLHAAEHPANTEWRKSILCCYPYRVHATPITSSEGHVSIHEKYNFAVASKNFVRYGSEDNFMSEHQKNYLGCTSMIILL